MGQVTCKLCKIKSSAASVLNAGELEKLEKSCVKVDFSKGDIIFKEGSFSSNIIYLNRGLVKLHMKGPAEEQIIKITKAPSFLGIPTTFGDKVNQYSATAIEDTTVCFIDIRIFRGFIFAKGEFAYEIIVELCRNELECFYQMVNRTQKHIRGRTADALLFFSNEIYGRDEFLLPLNRLDLGYFINTSRESICRILNELCDAGIIDLGGKNVRILNKEMLEKISKNG